MKILQRLLFSYVCIARSAFCHVFSRITEKAFSWLCGFLWARLLVKKSTTSAIAVMMDNLTGDCSYALVRRKAADSRSMTQTRMIRPRAMAPASFQA